MNGTERGTAPSTLVRGTIATHRHGDTRRTVHPRGVPVAGGTSRADAAGPRLHWSAGPTENIRVVYRGKRCGAHPLQPPTAGRPSPTPAIKYSYCGPRVPSLSAQVSRLSGFRRVLQYYCSKANGLPHRATEAVVTLREKKNKNIIIIIIINWIGWHYNIII